jgi:hypothetical protein
MDLVLYEGEEQYIKFKSLSGWKHSHEN